MLFQPMRLNATFIGTTSLGFISGQTYDITLHQVMDSKSNLILHISTHDRKKVCEYTSIQTLMKNWKFNQFHQDDRPNGFWSKKDYSEIKEIIMTDIRERKLSKILN
jgi:hypothetical protein